jgi:hypothetical protein
MSWGSEIAGKYALWWINLVGIRRANPDNTITIFVRRTIRACGGLFLVVFPILVSCKHPEKSSPDAGVLVALILSISCSKLERR